MIAFDLTGHKTLKADNWAKVYLNQRHHAYSVAPKYAQCPVHLVLTSSMVIIQDENFREIVRHRRLSIFCRNVMIYFDKPTKNDIVQKFHDSLLPGGYFFIGQSESLASVDHSFKYVKPSIYQKEC